MSKKYDVVAVTGKYTDREGNEKNRYLNIGAVIQTRNGFMVKLEAVPVGWDGWAYLNEPKERDGQQTARQPQQRAANAKPQRADDFSDMPDDIPF